MISAVVAWLLGAASASAQTTINPYEISWTPGQAPKLVPAAPIAYIELPDEPAPPPLEQPRVIMLEVPKAPPAPEVHVVTFMRPPAAELQAQAEALMFRQAPPGGRPKAVPDSDIDFTIYTDLPGPDKLFKRLSENQTFDQYRLEAQARPGAQRVIFPEKIPVSRQPYTPRAFPQVVETIEPGFIVHRKLLFEQLNFDRQGWEIGNIQPGISTIRFAYDVAMLPYHYWTRPLDHWDTSAGKCLPGDNTPLFLYREPLSVTGLVAEGAVVTGMIFAFP